MVECNSGTKVMTFTIALSAPSEEVRVYWGTADGSARASDGDYVRASGHLYLPDPNKR
jgi:hypothetical protein